MLNNLKIRSFEPSDKEPVTELLQRIWSHDPMMLQVYSVHRVWSGDETLIRHTSVATLKHEVIGVGSLIESTLHPRMLWAAINIAPQWQRRGVGSALYEALRVVGDGRPWLIKLSLRDEASTAFLRERGFYNPRDRSIMGVLDPAKQAVKAWVEKLPRDVAGYTFLPLDNPDNPATLEDVARVQAKIYAQYHSWNPPVEESVSAALAHYCGSNVIDGSHLCVFQGNQLIGAANLFQHSLGNSNEAYLAHIGVVGKDRPQAHDLTAALIRRTLEWVAAQGLKVRFEADQEYAPHRATYLTAPADEVDRDFAIFIDA